MKPVLFQLSAAAGLAEALCRELDAEQGELSRRSFPDGESYLRFVTPVRDRAVILLSTMDQPDPKIPAMLFAAAAAREQGATSVGLVAPYLAYMRQDKAFQPGEAVTAVSFARVMSAHMDWLATVDPHLHRYKSLADLYSVPAVAAAAAKPIADWIGANVPDPVIVGPDEESAQWVEAIARLAQAHSVVLRKVRHGDLAVSIDGEALQAISGGNLVIVDDIASSAGTLIEATRLVRDAVRADPICVVVHPLFACDAYDHLKSSGARLIVSTNTVAHPSNAIDIALPLAQAAREAMRQMRR